MSDLLIERDGDVTRLVLNRPEKRNALSPELVDALQLALDAAAHGASRLLVLQGAGRSFCAGFDFSGIEAQSDGDIALRFLRVERLLQSVRHAPFATLALIHGPCFGAGADLAAACAKRIAAPEVTFRMPGLRFGVVLGTRRLADLVGADSARALLETSRTFNADEALRAGLVQAVRPPADWPQLVADAAAAARELTPAAQRALMARTVADTRGADMAALAESLCEPGLRDRILAFLKESRRSP